MATTHKWSTPQSEQTLLSSELDALPIGDEAISSSYYDNLNGLWTMVQLDLSATFATGPTVNRLLKVYALYSLDGTNYSDGANGTAPKTEVLWSAAVWNDTSAHVWVSPPLEIGPFRVKFLLENDTNQALSASGHTLTGRFYGYESS